MRVAASELKDFAADVLRFHGVSQIQANSVAQNLVWSEMVGRTNFGLQRLPIHVRRLNSGVLNGSSSPCAEKIAESMEILDGDRGFGHFVGEIATQRAIELARLTGLGVVGVKNSNFFGAGAYFVKLLAEAGMIGMAMSNSFPKVVAHGGLRAVLGTNPFAFGAPRRNGEHLLIDMATSALAGSTVRQHIEEKMPLPEGLAIDEKGKPITDPAKVANGALLPFGGAKGFALSLIVEMLAGVLTGAGIGSGVASMYNDFSRSGDNGHFILALDIKRWMPLENYFDRFDGLIESVQASGEHVLLPGEIRWRNYKESSQKGISLSPADVQRLHELAKPAGLSPNWLA